jgi:hypothetical protein
MKLLFLLPVVATQTGGIASAAGAAAPPSQLIQPADAINLKCPLAKGHTRRINLSTGVAQWLVTANVRGDEYRATSRIRSNALPSAWQVKMDGTRWIQPVESDTPQPTTSDPFSFLTHFNVVKGPGEMRVVVRGRAIADEGFSVELIGPEPESVVVPSMLIINYPDVEGAPRPKDVRTFDYVAGEVSGSKNPHPGIWELAVTVQNAGKGEAASVGMMAQVELVQTCLNWGARAKKLRR